MIELTILRMTIIALAIVMQTPRDLQSFGDTKPLPVIHEFAPVARALLSCESRVALLTGEHSREIERLVSETVESERYRILSLDVFDTLLLRNDKSEARRFFEISQLARQRVVKSQICPIDTMPSDLDFLVARVDAMSMSYRTRKAVDGCREGHIRDVIRVMRRSLGLPADSDALFLETEISYEVDNLKINPVLLGVSRAVRERGGKVILVSDMYLGEEEIAEIVQRLNATQKPTADRIFSSADHSLSKRSGKIFKLIEQQLEECGNGILHIGDALEGDVFQARAAGWGTLHFPISQQERARRQNDLDRFLTEMQSMNLDVRRWAKV